MMHRAESKGPGADFRCQKTEAMLSEGGRWNAEKVLELKKGLGRG
jgi:hypothetical protein